MIKIAVDAMGGDHAPQAIVAGVESARDQYADLEFDLYGDPQKVEPLIKNQTRLHLVKTTEEIEMGEEPVKAIPRSCGPRKPLRKGRPMPSFRLAIPARFWQRAC